MSVIELTSFTVRPDQTQAMLDARKGMVEAFRADRRGFVSAKLVRLDENTWLDVVEWTDDTARDESRAKAANRPEIAAFFSTIDSLVSGRRGVRYDDALDGHRAVRTIAYGPHPSQVGELYLPTGRGTFPVVVLIHGGWWTAMFDRRDMTGLADDLVEHGYAVWNIEYRRLGEEDGGWPGTFQDVAAAIDAIAELDSTLDTSRVVVAGHSAGGHLAAWSAHRAALPAGAPGSEPKVRLVGAVSLAGLLDLVAADQARLGTVLADPNAEPPAGAPGPSWPEIWPEVAAGVHDGVVNLLLGGHADAVPDRYNQASPAEMGDGKVPVLAVHGAADDDVPAALSRSYLDKATAKGVDVRLVEVPSAGHFDVIDPRQPSWANVRQCIADQVGRRESREPGDAGARA